MTWTRVAGAASIAAGECQAVEVDGEHIVIVNVDGCFHALNNICTHQFAFMSEGYVEGEYIECPMHQGRFHIPTGAAQGAPVTQPLKTYPLKVEGEDVLIDLSAAAA
jgi:nitrite reductase/ring-hydroxylating ferredoxin subunit